MDYAQFSFQAMVVAAVVYLFAGAAHTVEWAAAKNATAEPPRKRRRVKLLVGGSGSQDETVDEADSAASGEGGESPRETENDRLRVDQFGRIGLAFTTVAFFVHLAAVITRGLAADRAPWANMHEFTGTSLALLVGAYLVMNLKWSVRWLGLFVALFSSIGLGLAVTVFYVDVSPLVPSLHSTWFMFHISAAMASGAAFTIGAVASVLYIVRERAERRGEVRGYQIGRAHV